MIDLLIPAVAGEMIPHALRDDLTKRRQYVGVRCAQPDQAFGCLTCGWFLANEHQVYEHLLTRADTRHVIARQCVEHGWEAP